MTPCRRWSTGWLWLLWVSLGKPLAEAKTVSGDFRLSGVNTEYTLASFAVNGGGMSLVQVQFSSDQVYVDDKQLRMRVYVDEKWKGFQKSQTCVDKIKFSNDQAAISFEQSKDGAGWTAQAELHMNFLNSKRAHYLYFVVDDCTLEMYMHDQRVPNIHYELKVWNDLRSLDQVQQHYKDNEEDEEDGDGEEAEESKKKQKKLLAPVASQHLSHFSADQAYSESIHRATFLLSTIIAALMTMTILMQIKTKHSVHSALFLVMTAAACDASSSLTELWHLRLYEQDGIGSYTLDALSAHLEAMCDSLVALLLLSIAAGWTLPSDALRVTQNATRIQAFIGGLQSPFRTRQSWYLGVFVIGLHAVLAQWGRVYNDDYDSYHELEHLPGKLLMGLRVLLGLLQLAAAIHTRLTGPGSLQGFYLKLGFVGTLWFQSLPVITLICNWTVPYYLRHFTVSLWGAVLQSSSLVLLSWLVTAHSSSYHKVSHLGQDTTLTDNLGTTTAATSFAASSAGSMPSSSTTTTGRMIGSAASFFVAAALFCHKFTTTRRGSLVLVVVVVVCCFCPTCPQQEEDSLHHPRDRRQPLFFSSCVG